MRRVALLFALAIPLLPGHVAADPSCDAPPVPTFASPLVWTKNGHQPLFVDFAVADPACPLPTDATMRLDGVACPTVVEETASGFRVRALDHPTIRVGAHVMEAEVEGAPAPFVLPFILT